MQNFKEMKQNLPPSRMGGNPAADRRGLGTAFKGNDTAIRPPTSINSAQYVGGNKLKEKEK